MRPSISLLALSFSFAPGVAFAQQLPDFDVTTISSSPATIELSQTLNVRGNVAATGTFVGNVPVVVVLSNDDTFDVSDPVVFRGFLFVPGEQIIAYEYEFAVDVPRASGILANAPANVILAIDPTNVVVESDETNNTRTASTLTIQGSDVRVTSIVASPNAFNDTPFDVTITLENNGSVAANAFKYRYFLSEDTNIRVFDQAVLTSPEVTVAAGANQTFRDVITIPPEAVTSTGSWYLGVVADIESDLFETSDRNNTAVLRPALLVRRPIPDLVGQIVTTATAGAAGESFAVTRFLSNVGVADAVDFTYRYVFSKDQTLDARDVPVATHEIGRLAVGDDYDTDLFVIPSSLPPGVYYVGLVIDESNDVEEVYEDNNIAWSPAIDIFEPTLQITTTSLDPGVVGVLYEAAIYATTGPLPVRFSVDDGELPPGLALNADGLVSGTPQEEGAFVFVVRASSGSAYSDAAIELRVLTPSVTPQVVTKRLDAVLAGRDFCRRVIAVGGQVPYRWNAISSLPEGVTLSPDGQLCGVVTAPGTYAITFEVTDDIDMNASARIDLVVVLPSETIQIDQVPLPRGIVGRELCMPTDVRFSASKGIDPLLWSTIDGGVPGLNLSADGSLCGAPDEAGAFFITVRVQDAIGLIDTALVTFEVLESTSFAISTFTLPEGRVGDRYEVDLEAVGDNAPVNWSILDDSGELPDGLILDADGYLNGTPTTPGTFAFAAEAVDARNQRAVQPFAIVVAAKPLPATPPGCYCVRTTRAINPAWLLLLGLVSLRRRRRSGQCPRLQARYGRVPAARRARRGVLGYRPPGDSRR